MEFDPGIVEALRGPMDRRILRRSQHRGRIKEPAAEDWHSGEGGSIVTKRRRSHGVLLIVSIGMIVGAWALLRADDETHEGIPASQSKGIGDERDPRDGWQGAFILVEVVGLPWDPCDLSRH
jgi:hypothetical protein